MKHGGLLIKHFCEKKSNIPNDSAEIVNFHLAHYKSMETISCHSNQNSYPTGIKSISFVEGNVPRKCTKFQLHPPFGFKKKIFEYVLEILPFMLPRQPIK